MDDYGIRVCIVTVPPPPLFPPHLRSRGLCLDLFQRRKRLVWISTGNGHVGAELGKSHGSFLPQSGVSAGDNRRLLLVFSRFSIEETGVPL